MTDARLADPVIIGDATIYTGDCMDLMRQSPKMFRAHALVTDPPYGVRLGSADHPSGKGPYESFDDTPENVRDRVVPAIVYALTLVERGLITPGTRCAFFYPTPNEIGSIYFPAGAGFSRWGFCSSQPILYYGKDPKPITRKEPNSFSCTEIAEKNGHPCPKPARLMEQLVARATQPGETVLDPFMGSGTTGVACMNTGRRFIGIELEPQYFEIARRRIGAAQSQGRLFA